MTTNLLSLIILLLLVVLGTWVKLKAHFGVINNTAKNRRYYVIYYTIKNHERKIFYLFHIDY